MRVPSQVPSNKYADDGSQQEMNQLELETGLCFWLLPLENLFALDDSILLALYLHLVCYLLR